MADLFRFDFDLVATATRTTRGKKPVLAAAELAKAQLPGPYLTLDVVRFHAYEGHGELRLPLDSRPVREWLRKQVFTEMPCIRLGAMTAIPVGVLVEPEPNEQRQHLICLDDATVDGLLRQESREIFRTAPGELPYQAGDILLVRESIGHQDGQVLYRADQAEPYKMGIYWCRNYHMPLEHCRLQLEVLGMHQDPASPVPNRWTIAVVPTLLKKEVLA